MSIFKQRSTQPELIDHPDGVGDLLIKNLREFEQINKYLGSQKVLIDCLNEIYNRYNDSFKNGVIKIADLGCGGGDLLWAIDHWALKNNIKCELFGFDSSQDIIQYASEQAKHHTHKNIHYIVKNIFSPTFEELRFDIVCLNNVCHHFTNQQLTDLLNKLKNQTTLAIIINDLHRHPIAYYGIRFISRLLNLSNLVRHDGPLSVLRAFNKEEVVGLANNLGFNNLTIKWVWPFRWKVILWCKKEIKAFI